VPGCGCRPDRGGRADRFVTGAGLLHTRSDLGIAAGTALLAVEGGGAQRNRRGNRPSVLYQRLDVDDYGTAVPLLLIEDFVGEESFYYISSDDVLIDAPFTSTLRNLAEQVEAGGSGVVAVAPDQAEPGRYGVLDVVRRDGRLLLTGLREKEMRSVPTRDPLVNISRYVLSPSVIDLVRELPVDPPSGERRITDALLRLVDSGVPPLVYVTDGQYFDIGDRQGLLAANNFMATRGLP
jgi:UTP--glucose-1-phosphate uridylyltransferase